MSPLWTAAEIAAGDRRRGAHGDFDVAGVTFDSREVGPGRPVHRAEGRGHRRPSFRRPGLRGRRRGRAGLRGGRRPPRPSSPTPMPALNDLGRASRARSQARIIGVTGSVGKTGTKEALFAALDRAAPGPRASLGEELQQPYRRAADLARMPREARFGVFEMGMNHAGELAALTRLVRPHVAHRHHDRARPPRILRQRGGDRRRQGRDLPGAGAGRHRDHPLRQPASRPAGRRGAAHAAHILTFGLGEGADVRAAYVVRGPSGGLDGDRLSARRAAQLHRQPAGRALGDAMRSRCSRRSRRSAAISPRPASRSPISAA